MSQIDVIKITFLNHDTFILTPEQYKQEGEIKGVLKSLEIKPKEVTGIEYTKMDEKEFDELEAWDD